MADPSDLDSLARRFLDLWQDQVAAAVSDPALADWLARLTALPGVATAGTDAASGGAAAQTKDKSDDPAVSRVPRGTPAAAAPSRQGGDAVEQLARRLAACEERLAALESRLDDDRGDARRPARRRRS